MPHRAPQKSHSPRCRIDEIASVFWGPSEDLAVIEVQDSFEAHGLDNLLGVVRAGCHARNLAEHGTQQVYSLKHVQVDVFVVRDQSHTLFEVLLGSALLESKGSQALQSQEQVSHPLSLVTWVASSIHNQGDRHTRTD